MVRSLSSSKCPFFAPAPQRDEHEVAHEVTELLTNSGNRDFFYFGHANVGSLRAETVYFNIAAANAFLGNNTNPLVVTNMHSCFSTAA